MAIIIVDTNVILAALIKRGIVRELIIEHPGEFITPDWCYYEVLKHTSVWNRNNLPEDEIESIIEEFMNYFVFPMKKEDYKAHLGKANKLIDDPDDVAILASALSIENQGIWTFNTKHFNQERIGDNLRILTTRDVIEILK